MKTNGTHVLTPQGLVHRSRVHQPKYEGEAGIQVPPPLAPIFLSESVLRALSPNGWKLSATCAADVPLGKMSVKFKVPERPTRDGAIIYLFPGAENAQMRTILQPVLQWGYNGAFGGDCWKISCWHASTDGHWYCSQPMDVNAGDVVTGTVEAVQCSGEDCTWLITASTDQGAFTVLDESMDPSLKTNSLMLFLIGAALEAYPEDSCCTGIGREQYPASETVFTDIELIDLAGNRFVVDWNARCDMGENAFCGCKNTVLIEPDKTTITLRY